MHSLTGKICKIGPFSPGCENTQTRNKDFLTQTQRGRIATLKGINTAFSCPFSPVYFPSYSSPQLSPSNQHPSEQTIQTPSGNYLGSAGKRELKEKVTFTTVFKYRKQLKGMEA